MKVAAIQMQPKYLNRSANLEKISQMLNETDADLIILPELCTSGYLFRSQQDLEITSESADDSLLIKLLQRHAKTQNTAIIAGFPEKYESHFFNSSVLVLPNGKFYVYRKIHLFYEEKKWFQPGDGNFFTIPFQKTQLGMMICFDWIFPESARTLALQGAEIICHPANLVLPYCQQAMITRSVENSVFSITANRVGAENDGEKELIFTGQSQILNNRGKRLAQAGLQTEEIISATIEPAEAKNKNINELNHLFQDRRTDFYQL